MTNNNLQFESLFRQASDSETSSDKVSAHDNFARLLRFLNLDSDFSIDESQSAPTNLGSNFPFQVKRIAFDSGVLERLSFGASACTVWEPRPDREKRHGFLWLIKGQVSLLLAGRSATKTIRRGNVAVFPPSAGFTLVAEANTELLFVHTGVSHFEAQCGWKAALQRVLILSGETPLQRCLASGFVFVNDQIDRLGDSYAGDLLDVLLCLAHGAIGEFLESLHPPITDIENRYKFEAMKAMHRFACRPDFNVKMVADSLGISSRYLSMLYRKSNDTPTKHALRIRMQTAADLLTREKNCNLSIEAVAHQTGYATTAHFSRSFHEFFGVSPTEYRNKKQK